MVALFSNRRRGCTLFLYVFVNPPVETGGNIFQLLDN